VGLFTDYVYFNPQTTQIFPNPSVLELITKRCEISDSICEMILSLQIWVDCEILGNLRCSDLFPNPKKTSIFWFWETYPNWFPSYFWIRVFQIWLDFDTVTNPPLIANVLINSQIILIRFAEQLFLVQFTKLS